MYSVYCVYSVYSVYSVYCMYSVYSVYSVYSGHSVYVIGGLDGRGPRRHLCVVLKISIVVSRGHVRSDRVHTTDRLDELDDTLAYEDDVCGVVW